MSDQLQQRYKLVAMWEEDEWPFSFDPSDLDRVNGVAPPSHTYVMTVVDGRTCVELLEYVGEYDAGDLDG